MDAEPRSLLRFGPKEPANDPLKSEVSLTPAASTINDKMDGALLSSTISDQRTRTSLLPSIGADRPDDSDTIQTILDCIIPARTFESEGKVWRQSVSSTPATRLDVLNLQEQLDAALDDRRAKKFGVCPIRRDIYDQLFDELIRQVAVNCAERGLLLMRVRDELRLTIATYQSLLESAVAYGLRKALLVEQQQSQAAVERDEERQRNVDLIAKVSQWRDFRIDPSPPYGTYRLISRRRRSNPTGSTADPRRRIVRGPIKIRSF
uniref:Uncharacterized protein n=1 Tax=Plectus sambesii TaxID=2011161 RepID=A0A914VYW9_9BILA